jgi:hypothetical protein
MMSPGLEVVVFLVLEVAPNSGPADGGPAVS